MNGSAEDSGVAFGDTRVVLTGTLIAVLPSIPVERLRLLVDAAEHWAAEARTKRESAQLLRFVAGRKKKQ